MPPLFTVTNDELSYFETLQDISSVVSQVTKLSENDST